MKTLRDFGIYFVLAVLIDAFLLAGVAGLAGRFLFGALGIFFIKNARSKNSSDNWIGYALIAMQILAEYGNYIAHTR